jgi:hypothetical protein
MGDPARGLGEASASNYGYPYRQTINLGNKANKLNTTTVEPLITDTVINGHLQ